MTTSQGTATGADTATFAHEDQLPRVPLPDLETTCQQFLTWCAPLLSADEQAETEAAVAEFRRPDGPGASLHAALAEYDASPGVHSWLDDFWRYRYLGRRDRIALNANFFFLFRDTDQPQLERAAGLIAGAVHHKQRVDRQLLPPVTLRGQPQSMDQHRYLFSSTRIPGTEIDTTRTPHSPHRPSPATARHIVVFHRGSMFRLDVLGEDGVPHSLDDLTAGLRAVHNSRTETPDGGSSVGHFTTLARAEWATTRESLLACHPRNADALEEVESALFCLCLEDLVPADPQQACDQLLHGNSGNRWFDKALSLIVFGDGRAGINVEHCNLDGTTVLALTDALLDTPAEEHARQSGARTQGAPTPTPVTFELNEQLRSQLHSAAEAFADYAANTATSTVSFEDFGANTAKALGVSPDAFVQLAYQLAHQRAKGHLGATYESIATRQFQHGRTEAMRVLTPQIQQFVTAMDDPTADQDTRRTLLQAAAQQHVARAKECQQGQAPEQHLWELELIQQRQGPELGVPDQPALYRTPGWRKMRDDYLSTSSAPSVNIQYFGFGSTSAQCIGVAYVLLPDQFHLYLSTSGSVAHQMHTFADQLRKAVSELRGLLAEE